jgi:hypothetical protein
VFLQGATDEFVLDLVEQCTFQKQRIMHLVMTSRYGSVFQMFQFSCCSCMELCPVFMVVGNLSGLCFSVDVGQFILNLLLFVRLLTCLCTYIVIFV